MLRTCQTNINSSSLLSSLQVGGNSNFKKFMEEYGVPKNISLQDKYNSEICKVYKEKILALTEVTKPVPTISTFNQILGLSQQGKPWNPPKQKPVFRSSQFGLSSSRGSSESISSSSSRYFFYQYPNKSIVSHLLLDQAKGKGQ